MKSAKMLTIVVVALGLMVWSAPIVQGAQYLTVNGQPLDSIPLKVGQSCTVEVVSGDSNPYNAYVGFDDGLVLGVFSHLDTMPEAGDLADATEYDVPAFYGYYISAAGSAPPPSAGVHFVFQYQAQEVGETDLKLYDGMFSLVDSVHITVVHAEMGTGFMYQGRLIDSNSVADGSYDFEFELYDAPSDGNQLGSTIDINDLDVIDGQFAIELDFGSDVFAGDARWLEIGVRPGEFSDPCEYTILEPRVELTPTPYSLYAETAGGDNDWRVSGDDMYSIPSGNVGIGTTNPQEKLDVDGPINTDSVYKIAGRTVLSTLHKTNTFVGIEAGAYNKTGSSNTFSGHRAGYSNIEGYYNTFLGDGAGYSNTKGIGNVFIGYQAGFKETGSNKLYIANSDAGPPLIYGDFSKGTVGIGTTSPGSKLDVVGEARFDGALYARDATGIGLKDDAGNLGLWVRDGGNVGIGTTNPVCKLEVKGRLELPGNDASGTAGTGVIEIGNSLRLDDNEIITNTDQTLYIQRDNNGDLNVDNGTLIVDASANKVGIGTPAYHAKFEVNGEISTGHDGLRWKVFLGKSGKAVVFDHGLNADHICSISCVFRDGSTGTGIAQEYQRGGDENSCFRVMFDDTTVSIEAIGWWYDDADDTYRCIVWYFDS